MLRERKKSSMKFIQSSSLSRQNEAVTVKLPTTVFVFLRLSVKKKKISWTAYYGGNGSHFSEGENLS